MKKVKHLVLFVAAIAVFVAVVLFTFKDTDLNSLLAPISGSDIAVNLLIGVIYSWSFGWLMALVFKRHYSIDFKSMDGFLLPFMMHIFSYVMPMQGGMLFQTFFMRMKYKMALTKGLSTGVYLFLASLFLTCVGGLGLSVFAEGFSEIRLTLLVMLLGLIGMLASAVITRGIKIKGDNLIYRIIGFLHSIIAQVGELIKQPVMFIWVMVIIGISAVLHAIWFYHTALILEYEVSFMGMMLATLVFRILMLVRLLPGNLGIQEVMTSLVFLGAGLTVEQGLIIAVFNRLAAVALAGTIGVAGLYHNFRYFGSDGIQELIKGLKPSN